LKGFLFDFLGKSEQGLGNLRIGCQTAPYSQ
jgi:hypothetical protein